MEVERRQDELVEQFVALAKSTRGRSAAELIAHATSHPSLFAFGELLAMPQIAELQNTEYASSLNLLKAFAHSTWSEVKQDASNLPELVPQQKLKLKQLTVLTLAETTKVLSYDLLMRELDIPNVRALEDFLINDCMYAGILKGRLDQSRRSFEVNLAIGRDLKPGQLESMLRTLGDWIYKSDYLLNTIEEKIKWADNMSSVHEQHVKEVKEKAAAVRKSVKADRDLRGHQDLSSFVDSTPLVLNHQERNRPKRALLCRRR